MKYRSQETWQNALDYYGHESPLDTLSAFYASLLSVASFCSTVYFRDFVQGTDPEGMKTFIESSSGEDLEAFSRAIFAAAQEINSRYIDTYHFQELIVLSSLMAQYPEHLVNANQRWGRFHSLLLDLWRSI